MAKLSIKTTNTRGNAPQFKENNGKVVVFPVFHNDDYIAFDAYQGQGSTYSEREEVQIEIKSDQIVFQGTFNELTQKLKPKTIYQFYIDTECSGMFYSEMFDNAEDCLYKVKSELDGFEETIDFNENYQIIEQVILTQKNLSETYELDGTDSPDQITINIQTFN